MWFFPLRCRRLAQIDPEYVIPKQNPYTTPADFKNGQQLFMTQCSRCHGPKGEGGRGAVLGAASIAPRAGRRISVRRDPGWH